ncbi:hypothetical protein HY374_02925 [Candidatus Berkelbacteria bacterium]|nr:hypothetical protein [Candidatus Berkelbacteria bacterium]
MATPTAPLPLVLILTLAAITLGYGVLVQMPAAPPSDPQSPPPATIGTIRGTTLAADGSHPADLVVCAQSTTEGGKTCVAPGSRATYELSVAPGQYLVSAHRSSEPELQAFYTDRVTCTVPAGCAGQPIVVNVAGGQSLEGIDPLDWGVD